MRRGAQARLLLDWVGSRDTPHAFLHAMHRAGVEVTVFDRPGWRRPWFGLVEGEPGRLRVMRALQVQATLARRAMWIADAYVVPSFGEVEALVGAARDGVDVRLLVPGRADHA